MKHPIRRRGVLLPLLVMLGAAGCSGFSNQGKVNGTVTLDGQPLKAGVVRFVPADGKSQTASADVADGKFSTTLPLGEMRVEFSAPKVVGHQKMIDAPDSPVVDKVEELIPARFNTRSDFKITVKRGSQDETFPLQSK